MFNSFQALSEPLYRLGVQGLGFRAQGSAAMSDNEWTQVTPENPATIP